MDVRMAVADLAVRWQDLGISLGIRLIDLDTILSHSSSDYLREMLTLWLRQYYNVSATLDPALILQQLSSLCDNSFMQR